MALPSSTDILIVGAGPAGMACALSLKKQGFTNFIIVDSAVRGVYASRAITLHAATLEALDPLGCAEPLVRAGRSAPNIGMWIAGSLVRLTSFGLLAPYTKFPFALVIPQNMSEKVLGDALHQNGIDAHRPHKVVCVQPNRENPGISDVQFEDGQVMQARCVVGADGARSAVRMSAGINYTDPKGESDEPKIQTVLADVVFSTPLSLPTDTAVNLIIKNNNMFLFVELPPNAYGNPDERVIRIGANIIPGMGAPPEEITIPYLQSLVEAFGPGKTLPVSQDPSVVTPIIEKVLWTSTFRTHSALADTFFTRLGDPHKGGVVVFVGDAAHIHSPAGGQGMNLGICDAIALGRVLAATFGFSFAGELDDTELRAWADARRKRALHVISIAERLFGLVTTPDRTTWVWGFLPVNYGELRNVLVKVAGSIPYVRMMGAWQLSGLAAKL